VWIFYWRWRWSRKGSTGLEKLDSISRDKVNRLELQIAGIILDNWARGRFQHVWFSMSRDLREDAQRDLSDLGVHLKVVDGCQELDAESKAFGLSSEFKEGVLFTTYSTLIGNAVNKFFKRAKTYFIYGCRSCKERQGFKIGPDCRVVWRKGH
jgi:hypothetical protein